MNTRRRRQFDGYDIIGDIHGCATALKHLLYKLGYREGAQGFVYSDSSRPRQAIFVGDLIDRGSEVVETLHIVKTMWDQGNAQVVLGNHELSAIAWHTPYQQGFIRPRDERAYRQLQATLEQFQQQPQLLAEYVEWFRELPLFIELDNLRVVHACWDEKLITQYQQQYDSRLLVDEILYGVVEKQSFAARFLERTTRGISLLLPEGYRMFSHDGFPRRRFRVKFWCDSPNIYEDLVFQPDPIPLAVAKQAVSAADKEQLLFYAPDEKPLFVGHYWLQGVPNVLKSNIACLDYSAVNGGLLVAYRMQYNDTVLSNQRFVAVDSKDMI